MKGRRQNNVISAVEADDDVLCSAGETIFNDNDEDENIENEADLEQNYVNIVFVIVAL